LCNLSLYLIVRLFENERNRKELKNDSWSVDRDLNPDLPYNKRSCVYSTVTFGENENWLIKKLCGEGRGVQRVLVGKHEGKRPLGRPRRRWEDNIKIDLQEVGRRLDGVGSG